AVVHHQQVLQRPAERAVGAWGEGEGAVHFQRGGVVGGGEHAQQVVGGVQGQRLHHVAGTVRDRHRITVGADRCRVDDNLGGTAVRDRGGPPVCSGVPVAGGTRGPREGCHLKSSLRGRRGQ